MWLSYHSTICLLVLSLLIGTPGRCQSADSLRARLAALLQARQQHTLKDTDYLRSVDSIAPFLEQDDSLPRWLATYREIVFSNPGQGRRRANYFTYMALQAYNANKFGSAIYYAEKNNEAKVAAGLFERGGFSHADLFALAIYYNNRNYAKVIERYLLLKNALSKVPREIVAGKVSADQTWMALSLLQTAVYAYCAVVDSTGLAGAWEVSEGILDQARRQPAKYGKMRPQFDYLEANMAFKRQACTHHPREAADFLRAAIRDVSDTSFPSNLVSDYAGELYKEAVDFYFDQKMPDSAKYYLDMLGGQGPNSRFAASDPIFLLHGGSRLQAGTGHYSEAYEQLHKAYLLRDSAFYAVSADRDNNLYALAEAENTRADLLHSDEEKRFAQQSNLLLFFLLFLLLLVGGAVFLIYRARQRRRLLDLQLHLARNFHDAIGPMLLYANALVKKEMDDHASPRLSELKGHISQIMDEVRSISHDLKSTEFGTIGGFAREMTVLLEKVSLTTGLAFTVKVENGDHVLSHFQQTHLQKVVQELISNSVKHAGCSTIELQLMAVKRTLELYYKDDGKGLDPAVSPDGIGLQNIRERIVSLQGSFHLNNSWPDGYSIHLSIPLL